MFSASAKPNGFGQVPLKKGDLGGLQYFGASSMPNNVGFADSDNIYILNIKYISCLNSRSPRYFTIAEILISRDGRIGSFTTMRTLWRTSPAG